jgi:hypothetical protein
MNPERTPLPEFLSLARQTEPEFTSGLEALGLGREVLLPTIRGTTEQIAAIALHAFDDVHNRVN